MYKEILEEIKGLADEKYREFHKKLIPGVETEFLGVRVPTLRSVAKRICKEDFRIFLAECEDTGIYEMIMLYGMVLAGAPCEFEEKLSYLEKFIPKIDNWAVCDTVCASLKDVKRNKDRMYEFLKPFLRSDKEYELRFAIVILIQYYLTEKEVDMVLDWYGNIHHEGYYVKMAVAWGISVCFVKFRDKTLKFLEQGAPDPFTYQKAIQKIRESYRVSREDKEMLKNSCTFFAGKV